jgi:3'-phosphoadenosine 5'-phosphosulfate sulfotransferase (PAPS reductase)/FAD synthetase
MRFCTSELKVDQITRALATRFHGRQIINVVGLRREESDDRAQKPISQEQKKLLLSRVQPKTHTPSIPLGFTA